MTTAVVEREKPGFIRGENGKFLPGTSGGPGRKKGRIDVYELCVAKAKEHREDLGELLWGVMLGLMREASRGNAKCATLVLKYLGRPVEVPAAHATQVNVSVDKDQHNSGVGPPIPPPDVLASHLEKLSHVAEGVRVRVLESTEVERSEGTQETLDKLLS